MALTETFAYKIEINEDKSLNIRRADIILKEGVEVARSYYRISFVPGSDVSTQPEEVQDVAALVWTPEIIEAYELASQAAPAEPVAY